MSEDKQEEQTERSQQRIRKTHRVGQIDPSLRTDRHYVGLNLALVLLITSVWLHSLDEYTFVAAGSVFVLAILVAVISFPYREFQK